MSSADGSVRLTAEQVQELNTLLSHSRHEINGFLSLIMSAMELAQLKPDSAARMIKTTVDQSKNISQEIMRYSAEFERVMQTAKNAG